MNDSLSTYCTIIYLFDALRAVFIVPAWRTGVSSRLLQAYAAALRFLWRLPRPRLLFDVLQKSLRRCPLGNNAQNCTIHIMMPLRNMIGVRSGRVYAEDMAEMPNAF